jgi:exodeoxyribonuclease III
MNLWSGTMKLASWNVNGIRAVEREGKLAKWIEAEDADVVCLQEVKAMQEQTAELPFNALSKYEALWHSAQKPGYSGTMILTRKKPLSVQIGLGIPEIDHEGRVLVVEFKELTLLNCYFPNSQRDSARLEYKLFFCKKLLEYTQALRKKGKHVVICGDFNIAHTAIDLKNPKSNEKNAGYLPEERAWMDEFLKTGYVDTFRKFTPDPGHYSWWSYRPGVREKNIGWRLDYWMVGQELSDRVKSSHIQPKVSGSDHCPVVLGIQD